LLSPRNFSDLGIRDDDNYDNTGSMKCKNCTCDIEGGAIESAFERWTPLFRIYSPEMG
jgi:hypothetical protein